MMMMTCQVGGGWVTAMAALGSLLVISHPISKAKAPLARVAAALCGGLFAAGLVRSGMANQAKVSGPYPAWRTLDRWIDR
jgi:hypothetical protein